MDERTRRLVAENRVRRLRRDAPYAAVVVEVAARCRGLSRTTIARSVAAELGVTIKRAAGMLDDLGVQYTAWARLPYTEEHRARMRKPKTCGNCGVQGHNRRTCEVRP